MLPALAGAITIFWYAVLTGRAFQMGLQNGALYEWAFAPTSVNWTAEITFDEAVTLAKQASALF